MRFVLIPDEPFSNVAADPNRFVVHPMRGATENLRLAARISGHTEDELTELNVGESLPTPDAQCLQKGS